MTITSKPSDASGRGGEHSLARVFTFLALAAGGMAAILALLPAAGHDQLWFLLMARRWLDGAPIYGPRIFDSNPPGIVWLSALPVLLGRALGVPATAVAKLLVLLAGAASACLSFRFLQYGWRPVADWERRALLFAFLVLFAVVPARDFGQRDQILAFLVLPYVLAAAVNIREHPLIPSRVAAGLLAGLGICLKPHHALIVVAVELFLLVAPSETRRAAGDRLCHLLRPETLLIAATGVSFLIAIHRLTPLYFTLALPILRDTYWAIGRLSPADLALQAIELCILAAITLTFGSLHRLLPGYPKTSVPPESRRTQTSTSPESRHLDRSETASSFRLAERPAVLDHPAPSAKPRFEPAIRLLLVAGSAATLAYFLQGTGWYYQQLPGICLFGAALSLQLLDLAWPRAFALPSWTTTTVAALCLLALGLTLHFSGYPFTPDRAFAITSPDPAFFTPLPTGAPVAILTTSVDAAMMPIERFHLTWAQRTNNLWLLPAILRNESPGAAARRHDLPAARLAALDALQHRWMVEDFYRWHPQLVLVERCQDPAVHCQVLEDRHDNLLAWFLRDPSFAALWRNYTYAGSRGSFDAYILKRTP